LGSPGQSSRSQGSALYSRTTAPRTFKLHILIVLIEYTTPTDFGVTRFKVKVTGANVNFLHEGALLATTAPRTFKLHVLIVLIEYTTPTDWGHKVKVTGASVNFLHEGTLLANHCIQDLQTSHADSTL